VASSEWLVGFVESAPGEPWRALLHLRGDGGGIGIHPSNGGFVAFGFAEVEQFTGVVEAPAQAADAIDHALKLGTFLAQLLGTRRIIPDIGVFQLAADFLQTFGPGIEVKDTPVGIAGVG